MKTILKLLFIGIFLASFIVPSLVLAAVYCDNYSCYNSYNNYGNCTYHAYKLCSGNNIYWYDSCGNQQDLVQTCTGINTTCKYGQCTYVQPYIPPVTQYIAHYKTACLNSDIYWQDSYGKTNSIYKSCNDANSCTIDSCSALKCENILKCDGTTCSSESSDYINYCASNNATVNNFSVSFFAKNDLNADQWQKTIQINPNGQTYFMISVVNNSKDQLNNVNVSANIPNEVSSLGNLKIDEVLVSGDIVSGINIGSIASMASKSITFEGKTQSFSVKEDKQAVVSIGVFGKNQTDSLLMKFDPTQIAGASISSNQATSGFWVFLKRWYLWILVGLVLIFIFIIIFKRLSSNT